MTVKALTAVLCVTLAPVAQADCVTADDLATGIAVTVKDKSVQTFRKSGGDVSAALRSVKGGAGFSAVQRLAKGLFVAEDNRTFHEAAPADGVEIVGGNNGGTRNDRYKWSGTKLPEPGGSVSLKVQITRDEDGPSIGPQPTLRGKASASVTVLAEKTVKISDCEYRIWPVETTLTAAPGDFGDEGGTVLTRRQIWFPDLGFAVTTKEVGSMSGFSEDWGQGIIGMAVAK